MPRFSLRSAALFVVAFCFSWQSAGTGLSTAQAGCGDYVHLGGMESAERFPAENFTANSIGKSIRISYGSFGLEPRERDHGSPRQPCHGPHCRQQPLSPAAPVPVTSNPQQKACLIEQAESMSSHSHALILDASAPRGDLPESRIERPPRRCS